MRIPEHLQLGHRHIRAVEIIDKKQETEKWDEPPNDLSNDANRVGRLMEILSYVAHVFCRNWQTTSKTFPLCRCATPESLIIARLTASHENFASRLLSTPRPMPSMITRSA